VRVIPAGSANPESFVKVTAVVAGISCAAVRALLSGLAAITRSDSSALFTERGAVMANGCSSPVNTVSAVAIALPSGPCSSCPAYACVIAYPK
jgi:hypothetical protein